MPEAENDAPFPIVESREGESGDFDLLANVGALPARVIRTRQADWTEPAVRLLATILLGVLTVLSAAARGEADVVVFGIVFFGALGLIPATILVRALTLKTTCTFYPDRVEFDHEWLLRHKEWSEPLAEYRGLAAERRKDARGRPAGHALTLLHRCNKGRNIVLRQSSSPEGMRKTQGRYARLLGLPGLMQTESGLEERAPDDVDRSVRERVAAGTLGESFEPMAEPPGRRLRVAIEDETIILRVPRGLGGAGILAPGILLFTGFAFAAITLTPYAPDGMALTAAVFLSAGVLAAVVMNALTEELRVSPGSVAKCWHPFWGGRLGSLHVGSERVTDVVIAKSVGPIRAARTIQVIADADTVHFGGALRHDAQLWVRDCIIAVISK